MSWFGGSDPVAELDAKIEEASSETIPNGEMDIAVGLEITDIIRSKKVPPKNAMRCLKKRLTKVHQNPNLLLSTLRVIDLCVKNCGAHFLNEIDSKEFVDYLVDYIFKIHYDVKDYKVYSSDAKYKIGSTILKFVKEWNLVLKGSTQTKCLERSYELLVLQGYEFPEIDNLLMQSASNFADSRAPPDWIDGNECMICYNPFSVMSRKHHCRACGGVFCQTHSSKTIPLPALGILQPVRVCDDCYQIHKSKSGGSAKGDHRRLRLIQKSDTNATQESEEDEQLRKAIELSLQESQGPPSYAPPPTAPPAPEPVSKSADTPEEEMDDDMKAAIEASLREYKQEQAYRQPQAPAQSSYPAYDVSQQLQPQPSEPELEFYQSSLPFDPNAYAQPQQTQPQAQQSFHGNLPQISHTSTGASAPPAAPQNQPIHQAQMTPQATRSEDLTEEEEELINLYLQLINGVKNDRSKQINILHDQNLNDLHARVIRLKPKLNRSLRTSIEKYELFLEMNNKLSTITRLYDQFLEAKLNMAYNRHTISSPQYGQAQMYGMPTPSGPQLYNQYSGQQKPAESVHDARSELSSPDDLESPNSFIKRQGTGYPEPPNTYVKRQGTGYPDSSSYSPSTPYPYDVNSSQSNTIPQNQPQSPSAAPYRASMPSYPSQPDYETENPAPVTNATTDQNTGFYPTEPPLGESDEESTTSVASRYPPVAGGEFDDTNSQPNLAHEHASERYPTIAQMEKEDEEHTLPTLANPQAQAPPKRPKSEPEPLIEL